MAAAVMDLCSDWVAVELHVWSLQLRYALRPAPPKKWLSIQLEVWGLLQLEKAHQWERIKCLRAGITDYAAGLPHVDTAQMASAMAMTMNPVPVVRHLVFIGGGHSHAFVLKMLGMKPIPGVQVTLITREIETPYSGMLPSHVAGLYTREQCHIDLVRLARFAGARIVHGVATGIDPTAQTVSMCDGRPPIHYDVLSVDIGSTPNMNDVGVSDGTGNITPVKPIDGFSAQWSRILARLVPTKKAMSLVVVGGGAGGVELVLAMQARIHSERGGNDGLITFSLVSRTETILPSHNERTREAVRRILERRGVRVYCGRTAIGIENGELHFLEGESIPANEVIWCAQASAAAWLKSTGLALDADGFIAVGPTLQSTSHPNVFAAGDVAAMVETPRPKAGVFAVRQGPPLSNNIRALLGSGELQKYVPQDLFLGLITTGDPHECVASRGDMGIEGSWLFPLKDWIDRKWMAGYTTALPFMAAKEVEPPAAARIAGAAALALFKHKGMRCGGCGAKVGATILSNVMHRISPLMVRRSEVLAGVDDPDDCAIVLPPGPDHVLLQTVDFFRAFWPDPFVFGQIAANHALSDVHAKGADAVTALALVVLPTAAEDVLEESLYQMMAGACTVLRDSNCALVGGHTGEGTEMSMGFAVNGVALRTALMRKGGMQAGQVLVLTKPLGTGILLAAEMRGAAKGKWVVAALQSMLLSNRNAGLILRAHGATACTDVTGFGLVGHLIEMLRASELAASVWLSKLPVMQGVDECIAKGVFSSLYPENARLRHAVNVVDGANQLPRFPVLFDPQTAGGLLASMPADRVAACIEALTAANYSPAIIGVVDKVEDSSVSVNVFVDQPSS